MAPPLHRVGGIRTNNYMQATGANIMESRRSIATVLGGIVMSMSLASTATAAEVSGPAPFGKTADGTEVRIFTLKNKNGIVAKVMTLGGTVVELQVPDKAGKTVNVVLGFDDVAGYQSNRNQHFGCITGRVCNRIAKAKFTLDGVEYKLAANDGKNTLHGGVKRTLDKVVWDSNRAQDCVGRRPEIDLQKPRRRRGLSRQPRSHRDLHPDRQE